MMWTDYSPSLESWKNRHDDIRNPFYTETKDYIKQYFVSKTQSKPKITKNGNTYIAKYSAPNKHHNHQQYRTYIDNADPFGLGFMCIFTVLLSALLCLIPSIAGVIIFTLINVIMFGATISQKNKYTNMVYGAIYLCFFLLAIFILHYIFKDCVNKSNYSFEEIARYQAFHTIYPEYLFKFKF